MTGMTNPIYVSEGMKRYVGGTITDVNGKDISSATYQIVLGASSGLPPASGWASPDVSTAGTSTAQRLVLKLVDNTVTVGTYWVWAKITDSPEIEPVLLQGPVLVA